MSGTGRAATAASRQNQAIHTTMHTNNTVRAGSKQSIARSNTRRGGTSSCADACSSCTDACSSGASAVTATSESERSVATARVSLTSLSGSDEPRIGNILAFATKPVTSMFLPDAPTSSRSVARDLHLGGTSSLGSSSMRRPCVGRIGLGRSSGVAESRKNTVLSRTRVLMVAVIVALVSMPLAAHAQSTTDQIAKTRAEIDKIAQQWFQSQQDAKDLDTQIAELQQQVTVAESDANRTAVVARARALEIYKGSGSDFGPVLDSTDALDSVRRAELLDRANAREPAGDRRLRDRVDRPHEEAPGARRPPHRAGFGRRPAREPSAPRSSNNSPASGPKPTARPPRLHAPSKPPPRRRPPSRARARPRPWRRAVRGNRPPHRRAEDLRLAAAGAVGHQSASRRPLPRLHPRAGEPRQLRRRQRLGLYYGAYQFAPTTWNTTANHAGRLDLIGVLAVAGECLRPGRYGLDALPVAGQGSLGRTLLTRRAQPATVASTSSSVKPSARDVDDQVGVREIEAAR